MKKLYVIVILPVLFYYCFFPQSTGVSLAVERNWCADISVPQVTDFSPGEQKRIVRSNDHLTTLGSQGNILIHESVRYDAALSGSYFINYDAVSQVLVVTDSDGSYFSRLETRGYPFFASDRLFVITTDSGSIREWSLSGDPLERYDLPSILTSLDASEMVCAAGMLNGSILICGNSRSVIETPGTSRYRVVYGVSVAKTGSVIAAVAGLEPQLLLAYGLPESGTDYVQLCAIELSSDYRAPVYIDFFANDMFLVVEVPGGVEIYRTDTWRSVKKVVMDGFLSAYFDDVLSLFVFTDTKGRVQIVSPFSRFMLSSGTGGEGFSLGGFDGSFFASRDGKFYSMSLAAGREP